MAGGAAFELSRPHPSFYTLNPQPHTPHPQPHTLNPTPQSPNPRWRVARPSSSRGPRGRARLAKRLDVAFAPRRKSAASRPSRSLYLYIYKYLHIYMYIYIFIDIGLWSKVVVQSILQTPRLNRFSREERNPFRGSRDHLRLAEGGALPYEGDRHCRGVWCPSTSECGVAPFQATQGPSWGYLNVHSSEALSFFGDKSPQNGSQNGQTAPITGTGCPHEGPSVDLPHGRAIYSVG